MLGLNSSSILDDHSARIKVQQQTASGRGGGAGRRRGRGSAATSLTCWPQIEFGNDLRIHSKRVLGLGTGLGLLGMGIHS